MRKTLRAIVVVGLVLWLLAIALTNIAMIVFAAVLVAWSVFHLLTDARS